MIIINQYFKSEHFEKIMFVCGMIEQLFTVSGVLYKEKLSIEEQKKNAKPEIIEQGRSSLTISAPIILTTLETALKSSIVFFQFSIIEGIVSVLSELTIQINSGTYGVPVMMLTQSEIDFLREVVTSFNGKKGESEEKSQYRRIEERIAQVPFLFAKLNGKEFKLDKSCVHWQYFNELKKLRDSLTHPKAQKVCISDKHIFNGGELIYWLSETYFNLTREALHPNDFTPYLWIENSNFKLIGGLYHATLRKFDAKQYFEKHKNLRTKTDSILP